MSQGLVLMVLGMGIVFCFLSVLVVALGLMSRVLRETAAEVPTTAPAVPVNSPKTPVDLQDPELLSAITAAVHSFRAKRDASSKTPK